MIILGFSGFFKKTVVTMDDVFLTYSVFGKEKLRMKIKEISEIGTISICGYKDYQRRKSDLIGFPKKGKLVQGFYDIIGTDGVYIVGRKHVLFLNGLEHFNYRKKPIKIFHELLKYQERYQFKVNDYLRWEKYSENDDWLDHLEKEGPYKGGRLKK